MPNEHPTTVDEPAAPADRKRFSQVSHVTGDVTEDGSGILLCVQTERDGPIELMMPTVDLQHLVTLLLLLGGKAATNDRFAATSETFWAKPLPLHGVSLGVDEDKAVLAIEVGASVLSFSLSAGRLAEIGRTILTLTAPSSNN